MSDTKDSIPKRILRASQQMESGGSNSMSDYNDMCERCCNRKNDFRDRLCPACIAEDKVKDQQAEIEKLRAERDKLRRFQADNHHNAAKCPYCQQGETEDPPKEPETEEQKALRESREDYFG